MTPLDFGGFGSEFYGDPFGGGGPLHVLRARAVKGQVVRVVYSEEPVHQSPSGRVDALNPANYLISVVTGQATAPEAISVDPALVVGPTDSVLAGTERAADVHTDRALIAGIRYRVTVGNVQSALGGPLGAPVYAEFMGTVLVQVTQQAVRKVDLTDLANNSFNGAYIIGRSGDVSVHGGAASLRKRIIRRAITPKGAFVIMPDYGVGIQLKEVANVSQLIALKADLTAQIKQEPEVADTVVTMSLLPTGVLTVDIQAKTKTGALVGASLQKLADGTVVIP